MPRLNKLFFLLLGLFFFFLLGLCQRLFHHIADFNVRLNSDGTADVTETRTYSFPVPIPGPMNG